MPKLNTNSFNTLDDMLMGIYQDLLNLPSDITTTRSATGGSTSELIGTVVILNNPRARLSRSEIKGKAFSPVGELLWYLSGSNKLDFISSYIPQYKAETDDGHSIYGAYGPRLLNMRGEHNQIENIFNLLKEKPSTRRAVIQLFDSADLSGNHRDIPCTCNLQFLIRDQKLHLYVSMRSNDAYKGLPHDIFAFTMLQEIIAVSLDVDLGYYYHSVGSLHLYENDRDHVNQYIKEGYQPTKLFMPSMPKGDPWPALKNVIAIEENIRNNKDFDYGNLDSYWTDIVKLVEIHFLAKAKKIDSIKGLISGMNTIYAMYGERKIS